MSRRVGKRLKRVARHVRVRYMRELVNVCLAFANSGNLALITKTAGAIPGGIAPSPWTEPAAHPRPSAHITPTDRAVRRGLHGDLSALRLLHEHEHEHEGATASFDVADTLSASQIQSGRVEALSMPQPWLVASRGADSARRLEP